MDANNIKLGVDTKCSGTVAVANDVVAIIAANVIDCLVIGEFLCHWNACPHQLFIGKRDAIATLTVDFTCRVYLLPIDIRTIEAVFVLKNNLPIIEEC
jgi:hypothetical protein